MDGWPRHARVLDGPGLWMEGEALEQLARVAAAPGCVRAVGLPDLHPGRGFPVGASFAFEGLVWPALLGGDLGCGVRLLALGDVKATGDALERRVRAAMDEEPLEAVDAAALVRAAWTRGPAGLAQVPGIPDDLAALAAQESPDLGDVGPPPDPMYAAQLGTIGGGNHFLELSRVDRVIDRDAASTAGLTRGGWAILAHSGSRGLGRAVAEAHPAGPLAEADARAWLAALGGATNFARTNRFLLTWRLLRAVGAARPDRIAGRLELVHNTVEPREGVWLHRKGSAPAERDRLTVVLGSRGAESWVMRGLGEEACLCSVAHGAGRRYDRGSAVPRMKQRHSRASLARTALGGRVLCDDPEALYAEHPDCYKPIEPVINALEAAGAAARVARLTPVLTVKR